MGSCFVFAQDSVRTMIEPQPLIPSSEWWQLLVIITVVAGGVLYTVFFSIRDQKNQSLGTLSGLLILRLSILTCLVLAALNIEKRREKISETPSTVAVILDNSTSMGQAGTSSATESRYEEAKSWIKACEHLESLTEDHQIVFYSLQDSEQLTEFGRLEKQVEQQQEKRYGDDSRSFGWWVAGLAFLLLAVSNLPNPQSQPRGLFVLTGVILLIFGALWISLNFLAHRSSNLESLSAGEGNLKNSKINSLGVNSNGESSLEKNKIMDVLTKLECDIPASRLNEAINWLLNRTDSNSLTGVVILSDGIDSQMGNFSATGRNAQNRSVTLWPIGFGATLETANVTVSELDAPKKVYKGNALTIAGSVSLASPNNLPELVSLTLTSLNSDSDPQTPQTLIVGKQDLEFTSAGVQDFEFEITNAPVGKREYIVEASVIEGEKNQTDNRAAAQIEVVNQTANVLIFSGGPSREFRFLRNQLFRDPNIRLDVFLQSAQKGSFQEADQQLTKFPEDENEFAKYDCLVAFDPDWSALTPEQTLMVRDWVADESGGLIVIAGPVNTPIWTNRPVNDQTTEPIRKLYPVTFFGQASGSIKLGRFGGEESFPLSFTREANSFDFLRFESEAEKNHAIWNQVEVYGFYAVNEEKAGAEVIAHFSDPLTSFGGKLPIYLASQLYGNGRVFFQASGELWRTRGVGPEFFEQYYSRLIRWVSQGRLLRNNQPMTLSLNKERCIVGESVTVRVVVNKKNADYDDLEKMDVIQQFEKKPKADGKRDLNRDTITLRKTGTAGNGLSFEARVKIRRDGKYRFLTTIPRTDPPTLLEVDLLASSPNAELNRSGRNEKGLRSLATESGGKYQTYQQTPNSDWLTTVRSSLDDHTIQSSTPLNNDLEFKRKLSICLLSCFSVFLITNWIIRRLNRLA